MMSQAEDDDLQVLFVKPAESVTSPSVEEPRPSSVPALVRPSPPTLQLAPTMNTQGSSDSADEYRKFVAATMKTSIALQKMLVQGAEDVSSINEMMFLKEEVFHYICLQFEPSKGFPPFPMFYNFSLFWIVMKAKSQGRRPTYAHHLADIIKARLKDTFPGYTGPIVSMTYGQIEAMLMKFGDTNRLLNPLLIDEATRKFEFVLGETFHYISRYYRNFRQVPSSLNFFFHICLFFRKLEFKNPNGEFFDTSIVSRLQRNLPEITPHYFAEMQAHLNLIIQHSTAFR